MSKGKYILKEHISKKYVCLNNLVKEINDLIAGCDFPYRIECMSQKDEDKIKKLLGNHGCHSQTDTLEPSVHTILAINQKNGDVASFLTWSNFVGGNIKICWIMWSCTKISERNKSLSTLLRLIPILYGIRENYDYVVADTNEKSSKILVDKFGFEWKGDYDLKIGELTRWEISANAVLDLGSEENMNIFWDTFDNWKKCLTKK